MIHYAATIFLSAFLIFQIQPMISKYILPWFGGTPAVWSTSMLFFQMLLLGGYSYAHLLAQRWQPRSQGSVHIAMLLLASLSIIGLAIVWGAPLLPDSSWKPANSDYPIWRILGILLVSVGLPYFVLSTTGPLLQYWFRFSYPARSPYRLYSLSNLGSLLGLVTYPILVEPLLALRHQTMVWPISFLVFAVLCAVKAFHLKKADAGKEIESQSDPNKTENPGRIPTQSYVLWVALAGVASLMLLATTNQMSQEITVVPFLWVLPLVVYLLSFIIAFGDERWYSRFWYLVGLAGATVLIFFVVLQSRSIPITIQIMAYVVLLFFISMICHGELYRARPDPRHLTSFYLMVSVGGALGGIFVNFAAPFLFKGYWEFVGGILAAWILYFAVLILSRSSILQGRLFWVSAPLLLGGIVFSGLFTIFFINAFKHNVLEISRNFYGVLRVVEAVDEKSGVSLLILMHGTTVHGAQYRNEEQRYEPTTYYHINSGSGLANFSYRDLLNSKGIDTNLRVGVVGMGIATLAAYGHPQDYFRFYEINPEVVRLAEGDKGYFSFMDHFSGDYDIVIGDARVSLEEELRIGQSQNFDILYVDVFSSDSVPAHLLTKEAFAVYIEHLKPGGVIAVNVTNHYLDVRSVVQRQAEFYNLYSSLVSTGLDRADTPSDWVLLSDDSSFFEVPAVVARTNQADMPAKPIKIWTDDFSNLFQIIK